ncbi:MAG: sigma-70 family RNA polymerase sigma factor [Eubacteriales bacterium]|nr:sigma-70 family RNA polymerase sigma factor [Eubacteriales bacterium]
MEQAYSQTQYDSMLEEYCKTRNEGLRNELVQHYLYIAQIAAKKFTGRGVEYDDLFQVASLALLRALERYDFSRGVKFGSFATPSVIGEIKNYFRDKSRSVRLPRRMSELMKRMLEAQDALVSENDRQPRPEELADRMNLPLDTVYELLEAKAGRNVLSLDEMVPGKDNEKSLAEMLGVDAREYTDIENADYFRASLARLSEMEQSVLIARFVHDKSQRDIAESMGVSQMYISRMERRILAMLKREILEEE